MRYENAGFFCSKSKHFQITQSAKTRRRGRSEINPRLSPQDTFHNVFVQNRVGLKAEFYLRVEGRCCLASSSFL